jgi:hypothetical protein
MPGRIFPFIGRTPSPSITNTEPAPNVPNIVNLSPSMEALKKVGRASLEQKRQSLRSSGRGTPRILPAKLEMEIESPPLVFYGPTTTSTGALLSGQLKLVVQESEIHLSSFDMLLRASITMKKPVSGHCADCTTKVSDLFQWTFLKESMTLKRGTHEFPFSYLLPGHLPASARSALASIDYSLAARTVTSLDEVISLGREVKVYRAIMPGNDKTSVRIFPPTTLKAHVTLPSVIHPIGEFPVYFRLDGCVQKTKENMTRWKLRKASWSIEEYSKMVSPACAKHAHKIGGEGKGVLHDNTRTIGFEELKGGWKTDFESGDGQVEMEFKASIKASKTPVCDVESPIGFLVSHSLVVEVIVAEEYVPNIKKPQLSTPTGTARILKMSFKLMVTERGGLGISWDEEQPPIYTDVPASPPGYIQMDDYVGQPLVDPEVLEGIHFG